MTEKTKWLIGLVVPIIGGLIVALFIYILPSKQQEPKSASRVQFGDNAEITNSNIAGRDIVQNIQGIDERKLAEYLKKLKSTDKKERKKEIQGWYET